MDKDLSNTAIKLSDSVRETANQDGAVLLDVEQGVCFSLNTMGLKIWRMLKAGCSPFEVAASLRKEFNLPPEQIERDVAEFLSQLRSSHLVRSETMGGEEEGGQGKSLWPFARRATNSASVSSAKEGLIREKSKRERLAQ